MAAVSTLPVARRKKHVYGKLSSKSNWNLDAFFDEDELIVSEPTQPTRQHHARVEVQQPAKSVGKGNEGSVKTTRPRPKRHDTFDVPSSDDELTSPVQAIPVSRLKMRPALVDDTDSSVAALAPWERKKVQSDLDTAAKKSRYTPASPDAQLKQDLERATLSPERNVVSPPAHRNTTVVRHDIRSTDSPVRVQASNTSSAAVRLAARRKEAHSLPKRPALAAEGTEGLSRKRARTASPSKHADEDVIMTDSLTHDTLRESPNMSKLVDYDADVYDVPASSENESLSSKPTKVSPKRAQKVAKRGKVTTYSSKSTAKKGFSAPGRLVEMIATDTDTTEPPTRSPSIISRRSTPQQIFSTPPSGRVSSPEATIRAKGTVTPKQAELWNQLLPSDPIAPSPSALAIKDLKISQHQRTGFASAARRLIKSQSDVPTERTRLVDRLKASLPDSDDEMSDQSDSGIDDKSPEKSSERELVSVPQRPAPPERKPSQKSQSQSQTAATGARGPKITYSSVRSFLPEESAEADFMAGLEFESPMQSNQKKPAVKSTLTSQKSAFDLEDIEEDGSQGGIRSVHELRASGRTISGMYDIQELLSEIRNHSAAYRSRRRSALIELGTKFADKAFATRFVAQSLETELAKECGAPADEISGFLLAAAVAFVLVSEPPEHTVRLLRDEGVVIFLSKLLEVDMDIVKLGKERKNNMSKQSQRSLTNFASLLINQPALWSEEKPKVVTPRLIALKALDLLIGKLRRLGDRSDLLSADKVQLLLQDESMALDDSRMIDVALSISILESLSTTSTALQWPANTIKAIAQALPRLKNESSLSRHALFLMLRLCLNLTNDNIRNCEFLSTSNSTAAYLLATVKSGFDSLDLELEDDKRALALDLLVLAMGIMINLTENCDLAREHALQDEGTLSSLIEIFQRGQQHMLEAESVEESVSNVAYGYLAVMLSNICQNSEAKAFFASKLPGKNLGMLVEAVDEFVQHHQKVDMMNFDGEEGAAVWGAFTEKLKTVLARLKAE